MRRPRIHRAAPALCLTLGLGLVGAACGTPDPPPPPPAACEAVQNPLVDRIPTRVNSDRVANGLGPLAWNGQLSCNAQDWASHLASITQLVHQDLSTRIGDPEWSEWNAFGENILQGPGTMTGDTIENTWMNSAGHRDNILRDYDSVGIGVATSADGRIWAVQEFGRHR